MMVFFPLPLLGEVLVVATSVSEQLPERRLALLVIASIFVQPFFDCVGRETGL